jgi:hypothetical protein
MATVIADSAVQSFLTALTDWTEIRDADGKLIGHFAPADGELTVSYAELGRMFDPEELKRRRELAKDDPGKTLDQIVERLRSLENAHEVDCRLGANG